MCLNKEVWLEDVYPLIEQQLCAGGSASFTINGTSMLPFLRSKKDSVKIANPNEAIRKVAPKKYDIIFYRRANGDFVLHRIVKVENGYYICRGDNQVDNEQVDKQSVIAVATEYCKNGVWKPMGNKGQRIYSFFWVNTMIIRKIKRKIFSIFKKK